MALVSRRHPAFRQLREGRALAALAACLMLGACAQTTADLGAPNLVETASTPSAAKDEAPQKNDLEKATEYWAKQYAENPRDLKAALSYARNLKAMGEKQRAMAVLQQASIFHNESRELASDYGRLALELDQVSVASRLLAYADDPVNPDWKVISARGTVLAKQGKYSDAIPFYEHALSLAHNHPSVLSNLALAHAMNGEPAKAETMLRQASAVDPSSLKIRQNLALVLGLEGKYDEAKQVASRDLSPENASENTAYLRRVVKLEPKAAPARAAAPVQEPAPTHEPVPAHETAPAHKVVPPIGGWEVSQVLHAASPTRVAHANVVLPTRKPNAAPGMAAKPAPQIALNSMRGPPPLRDRRTVVLPVRKADVAVASSASKQLPQLALKPAQDAQPAQDGETHVADVDTWTPQVVALSNARDATH